MRHSSGNNPAGQGRTTRSPGFTPGKGGTFTLIELLVVIAIIAILAAILFPVFAQAREKARQTTCVSNTKQIGLGLMQYVQDYDETFPKAWFGPNPGPGATNASNGPDARYKWMDAVYPYVKNQQVFVCPSASGHEYRTRTSLRPGATSSKYGSYPVNASYWGANDAFTSPSGGGRTSLAQLAKPAETVWAADGNGGFEFAWQFPVINPTIRAGSPRALVNVNASPIILERHQGTTSVLWCDGHVKATKLDKLVEEHIINGSRILHHFTVEDD